MRLKEGVNLLEFGYGSLEELVQRFLGAVYDGSIIGFVEVFDIGVLKFLPGWYFISTLILVLDIKEVRVLFLILRLGWQRD